MSDHTTQTTQPARSLTKAEKAEALEARAKLYRQAHAAEIRAAETKRKIVVGGTVLAMMQDDPDLHRRVVQRLREMTEGRVADQRAVADLIFSAAGPD